MKFNKVILFLLVIAFSTFACAKKNPKIVFQSTSFDLGIVSSPDRIKTFDAVFDNKGGDGLVISEIRTDCDCTTTEFPRKEFSRRTSGKIKIRVDLSGFFPGKVIKKVAVYTNSKKSPTVITITANVK